MKSNKPNKPFNFLSRNHNRSKYGPKVTSKGIVYPSHENSAGRRSPHAPVDKQRNVVTEPKKL